MELLRYAEFGMYGLAINYSDVEYYQLPRIGDTCGDQFCNNLGRWEVNHHSSVTLCGKCIDSSDLGNLMFGVGDFARGFSAPSTFSLAQGFNVVNDYLKPLNEFIKGEGSRNDLRWPFNEDPRASIPGWFIAAYNLHHAYNKDSFCEILSRADAMFGIHEDSETAARCPTCSDYVIPNQSHSDPDSINRVGASIFDQEDFYPADWFISDFYPLVEPLTRGLQ